MTTTEPREDLEIPIDLVAIPSALEWKALPKDNTSSPLTGVLDHNDADGTITALVAVSGVVDEVGDIIVPGSLDKAVKRLRPKGVMSHNWGARVSKLVWALELMPGDHRLPKQTPQGDPWPANAGGLLIKARYNLNTDIGRTAYEEAKFYGEEECFSIGYKVRPGGSRMRSGKRHLLDYDIFEWSQVLHGAHRLAHLTGVKSLHGSVEYGDWYDGDRSGSLDQGSVVLADDGVETKIRIVRDSQFWGLPYGTPIRAGMKPHGRTQAATPQEIAATTAPQGDDESVPKAPGQAAAKPAQDQAAPDAVAVPPGPGVPAALTALRERYADFAKGPMAGGEHAAANLTRIAQFAQAGADVRASADGQLAAVHNGEGWTLLDTANASPLPGLAADIAPETVDRVLQELADTDIPWDDVAARRERWKNAKVKKADQDTVSVIIAGATPFGEPETETGTDDARRVLEDAIDGGDRDEIAEALTAAGLPDDQDPHEAAGGLLALPTESRAKRIDTLLVAKPAEQDKPAAKPQAEPEPKVEDKPTAYKATGNVNDTYIAKLTDEQLEIESDAAHERHMRARANGLPRNSVEFTDSKLAATIYGDEARRRARAAVTGKPEAKPEIKPGSSVVAAYRAGKMSAPDFQAAVAASPEFRPALLAELGVDEVESLLEHSFLSGDTTYRDQVIDRLAEIDSQRAAGPRRAAAERDRAAETPAPPEVPEPVADEHGLIESPDGELQVTEEVAARQDRITALLGEGDGDDAIAGYSNDELGSTRRDLAAELRLQDELRRREAERKQEQAAARAAREDAPAGEPSDDTTVMATSTGAEPELEDTGPKLRPGLAGAAEDLGDALNETPRNHDVVTAASERFAKLVRRQSVDSKAFITVQKAIAEHDGNIHAAVAAGDLKAGMLFTAAAALREERRVARNAAARDRRKVRRIERERIRSLIGTVDAELRNRGLRPEDYGGAVESEPSGPATSTTAPPDTLDAGAADVSAPADSASAAAPPSEDESDEGWVRAREAVAHDRSSPKRDRDALAAGLRAMGVADPDADADRIIALPRRQAEAAIDAHLDARGAQSQQDSGGTDGPTRDDPGTPLPVAPAESVGSDSGPNGLLRSAGDDRQRADSAGGRRDRGDRSARGDLPGQSGTADRSASGSSRTGDTGDPDQPDSRPARAGESGGSGAGRGDSGLSDGADRTGDAAAGSAADATVTAAAPEVADQPEADTALVDAIPETGVPFRPGSMDDLAPAGKKAKLTANMAALRVLRQLQDERRSAASDEQAVLARWAGWGGLPEVFDNAKPEYASEREELRGLLSESEWNEARRNTLNAHYTDARVVQELWRAVGDLGFDGGRVLEPGSGSGTFIGFAPEHADMVGVELDSTTAAISRALYPHASVRNESFAATNIPAGSFDLTIGNVPFGKFALTDRVHNKDGESIHNHFILKSLALTRPGGLVTVLTSRFTLDSKDKGARVKMAEMGDLVGAVRLPTGSHQRASGTNVIEDVLIFRRREPGTEPLTDQSWINSKDRDLDGWEIPVNDYFVNHPEHVLGTLTGVKGQFGGDLRVVGDKDMPELAVVLDGITERAQADGLTATARVDDLAELVDPDTDRHEGHIGAEVDGSFTQAVGGAAVAFEAPKKQAEELRGLVGLRDTLRALLRAEAASVSNSPEIRQLRADLNTQYDNYVARFGPINRYTLNKAGNRINPGQGGFRRDPMSAIVRALEVYDADSGTGTKTAIFRKRAVAPRELPTTADTPADALALCLDTYGEVRLSEIAGMLGTDERQAREGLAGLIFEQPPLTDIELAAVYSADANAMIGQMAGFDTSRRADLSTVGESARREGKLEPAAAYLSGNVRHKLAVARVAAEHDAKYLANVEALETVLPEDLTPEEIDGRLGAAWIGPDDVRDFIDDLLETGPKHGESWSRAKVATSGGGIWTVEAREHGNLATEVWGTDRKSAGDLIQAMLEQRSIRVTDTIKVDGKSKSIPNLDATLAAQEKAAEIQEWFSEWLWEDPDRARRLQIAYNERFNSIVLRNYDSAQRTFPGISTHWKPRPHQVAAVERIVSEPCALLGHVVGAGKTGEMAMGAWELKRLGLVRKPCIVVPNHMKEQFEREFLEVYPQAKLLAAGSEDLDGDKRREFVARAATGDWDCVILTQSAFESIPMSREQQEAYIDRELATMRAQLEDAKERAEASGDKAALNTVKKMEASIIRAEEALKKKLDKTKDVGVTFEETGIDYLFVDEAHQYSNLRTLSNIQGAATTGSDRASDLHMKIEFLRENNVSGRVATFATGTPIRNSVTQAYVMQRFMRPDLLRDAGIHSFDQWAATFGQVVDEMELKPEGTGFRQTSRFARFRNVPELLRLFHVFADIKTAEDLKLPTPELKGGAVQTVIVPASAELRDYVRKLGDRADAVRNKEVEPEEDNMLKISGDGRKAALSMKLVGGEHEPGKIEAAADRISAIYEETKDRPVPCDLDNTDAGDCPPPGSMQIVFLDIGTPRDPDNWNAYAELRRQLAERGMDPKSIRFMHDAKNDAKKAELFAAARNGQVSVLVGSTEKMGVGTNVQRRAVALHHLDAPWRPSDVEQRDGRIMRQGNMHHKLGIPIEVIRYATEGSFDAYMWQTLERKAKFIAQIMKGKLDTREIEDVSDSALSYAEVKALATGNPLLMDKAKVDTVVSKLAKLERSHGRTQGNLKKDIASYTANAAVDDAEAAALDEATERRIDTHGDAFRLTTVANHTFTERKDTLDYLRSHLTQAVRDERYGWGESRSVKVATIGGHTVMARPERGKDRQMFVNIYLDGVPGGQVTRLREDEIPRLSIGFLAKIENNLEGFERRAQRLRDKAAHLRDEVARMQARVGVAFGRKSELEAARIEQTRLNEELAALVEEDKNSLSQEELASRAAAERLAAAREAAKVKVAQMGRSTYNQAGKDILKQFANPIASGKAYTSSDGLLAAMGESDNLKVFLASDATNVRPGDLTGTISDPQALLNELAALDLPWSEGGHAINSRWNGYDDTPDDYQLSWEERSKAREARRKARRAQAESERAMVKAIFEHHLVPEEKALPIDAVIPEADLVRLAEFKAKAKLTDPDDTESYAETVEADISYYMDASGVYQKVTACPTCGTEIHQPVFGSRDAPAVCTGCGTRAAKVS